LKNRQIPRRSISATCEEKQLNIAQLFVENPHLNLRKANITLVAWLCKEF